MRSDMFSEDNIMVVIFSVILMIHWVYLVINSYFTNTYKSTFTSISLFASLLVFNIIWIILANCKWYTNKKRRILYYVTSSILSVHVAMSILIKSILCSRFMEIQGCTNRPITELYYIYAIVGPILFLVVFNNHRIYQLITMSIVVITNITLMIIIKETTVQQWISISYIIGGYLFGLFISYSNQKTKEKITELNQKMKTSLETEIQLKSEKQKIAESAVRFTNFIFHEIRIPLNTIILCNDLLNSDPEFTNKLSDLQIDYFHKSKQGLDDIEIILNDALDIAKINDGKFTLYEKPFSLNKLLHDIVWGISTNAKQKDLEIKLELDSFIQEDKFDVVTDALRMKQILSNLISNAIKFTEKNGNIIITSKVNTDTNGMSSLYISVKDSGIGISKKDQDKLFKIFSQTWSGKGNKSSSGLGLSILAAIVDVMKGRYGVQSSPNMGSLFWIEIPIHIISRTENINQILTISDPILNENQQLNIVVADDDMNTRLILQRIFQRMGHKVQVVSDGKSAVDLVLSCLNDQNNRVDLCISDFEMGEFSGDYVISQLKELENGPKLVILSGHNDIYERILKSGANYLMVKPCNIKKINQMMNELFK